MKPSRDRGAVFPLYIWMVSGLLLVALLLFVFAQAAFTRSGGQSAADAAALAAVREARDRLHDDFVDAIGEEDDLGGIVDGEDFETDSACRAAADLAERNGASVVSCVPEPEKYGYRVMVETNESVGESVLPGTGDATARASALAVIESRCAVGTDTEERVELDCADGDWIFDPEEDGEIPQPRDLFRIQLED